MSDMLIVVDITINVYIDPSVNTYVQFTSDSKHFVDLLLSSPLPADIFLYSETGKRAYLLKKTALKTMRKQEIYIMHHPSLIIWFFLHLAKYFPILLYTGRISGDRIAKITGKYKP